MALNIALAGNPNCGKTTLFNELAGTTQYVGNWPGVTVEKKTGKYTADKSITITDLPGVYSLMPYSPEEIVTRDYLLSNEADVVVNVVDATNLERSLYLTTQIIDTGIPTVIALNMIDLIEKHGDKIDITILSAELGCPVVEISALRNKGVAELVKVAKEYSRGSIESQEACYAQASGQSSETSSADKEEVKENEQEAAARYDRIAQICEKCIVYKSNQLSATTQKIDSIVTNRFLGIPIFIAVMFAVYYLAVTLGGGIVTDWANDALFGEGWTYGDEETGLFVPGLSLIATEALTNADAAPWIISLVVDGIFAGVGAVIGFVPQLIILFLLLAILEGCGYMARVAFIMDRVFRRFGLSGKSVIPMLIASGCGVPAIMSTKAIEKERDKRLTIMTTTMIPCSAKLPIIALVFGALSGSDYENTWWVAPLFYFMGLIAIIISCIILKKFKAFAGFIAPFIMELPQYHLPTVKSVLLSTWERVKDYIAKAGTIIFLSTIVIWFLMNFGYFEGEFGLLDPEVEGYLNFSFMAAIGNSLSWFFMPLGFGDWQSTVTSITGLVAKENVVATVGILANLGEVGELDPSLWEGFAAMFDGNTAAIMAFCAFNLLCAPCFAAIGAISSQMKSAKWTWATILYMCSFAWCLSLMIYQFGGLITAQLDFNFWTIVAGTVFIALLVLLFRPPSKVDDLEANDKSTNTIDLEANDKPTNTPIEETK